MDSTEIAALPELLYQAQLKQIEARERLLHAKLQIEQVKAAAYEYYLEKDQRRPTQTRVKHDPAVIEAITVANAAQIAFEKSCIEAARLSNVLNLAKASLNRPRIKIVRRAA